MGSRNRKIKVLEGRLSYQHVAFHRSFLLNEGRCTVSAVSYLLTVIRMGSAIIGRDDESKEIASAFSDPLGAVAGLLMSKS